MKNLVLAACGLLFVCATFGKDKVPAGAGPAAMSTPQKTIKGKVVETMNTAGYTYVLVDTGSKKLWAAAPQYAVKVGDTAEIGDAMPMPNYHSKTLNRDFDVVYFTGAVVVNGVRNTAAGSPAEMPKGHPPVGQASAKAKVDVSGIKKAEGGNTVSEVYANQAKLNGKETKLRGKVVKYNAQIMGKNWLHIQDGTGSTGSNDLLVTTTVEVKVGDTVLVTGKVALNRDFGANYRYAVMIEDATVKVE